MKNQKKRKQKKGERKSYQQFIDEIYKKLQEKKEIEELYKRVIIFKASDVLEELRIRKKNTEALEKYNGKPDRR
ncbi:MAG: hypothetical protein EVJ46_08030 [Candidatus Acididesulfobacter guangdongensis]|uniref:Uncharacterized protein n=1 Tax=Acididesulfobacter guangdongensis TaxID=2597225 RepID=A0A519BFT5_ACIG2|nr:MAG: hypothetical protein EVJ46_08030 [Candidatus Acididesulfobacter guangdongensis]